MFSCEITEIIKNTYFEEHLRMTASGNENGMRSQTIFNPVTIGNDANANIAALRDEPFPYRKRCRKKHTT